LTGSEPRIRLFAGLQPPAPARAAIAAWADEGLGRQVGLRVLSADALHVTIAFLGGLPPDAVQAAAEALDRAPREVARLVPAGAVGVPRGRPRLVALDLQDPSGAAGRVHAVVTRELARAGLYEPDERAFWPHLTLARARRGRGIPRARVPDDLPSPPHEFEAPCLVLYRSHLGREGARYEPVHVTRLDGG
jgi:2'-5' RNA ligase